MPINNLLNRLNTVKKTGHGRWIACCPAHPDKSPSLSVRELPDGRVLIHCFAGCDASDILNAVGLEFSDLMPKSLGELRRERQPFYASDIIKSIRTDAQFLLLCTNFISRGNNLIESDQKQLEKIVQHLNYTLEII